MILDIPTLMLADAFVCSLCGVSLISVWWQHRKISIIFWAAGFAANGAAVALLAFGMTAQRMPLFSLGLTLLLAAPMLIWCGLRFFFREPLRAWPVVAGFALWFAALLLAPMDHLAWVPPVVNTLVLVAFYCAAFWELLRHKAERLRTRVPLALLTVPYIFIYLMAIPAALDGQLKGSAPPPLASMFGMVHFYTLIYAIGATVLLVAMKKERVEQRLLHEAQTDSLTGLANRRAFLEIAERAAERCRRKGEALAVIVFDLDRFKSVNDTFGHAIGDTVLRTFAATAREMLRPGDIISRVGGEEFFALLPGAGLKDGCATAERVRNAFSEAAASVDGRGVHATVSAGVMASEDSTDPLATLLERADAALYRAKLRGRDCVECGERQAEAAYPRLVRVA